MILPDLFRLRLTRIQRSRLILASLLAVAFVPASALAYLQYRTLSEVQQQTRVTMNANLQQALLGARAEAVTDFSRWPDQAFSGTKFTNICAEVTRITYER